ncbi:MAG: hypothetical protein EOP00_16275 [Pedobacter sp.]|nr:MAG: hypothetical protein EOP00_16275 [Pedobacter sp.]
MKNKRSRPLILCVALLSFLLVFSCKKEIKQLFGNDENVAVDVQWAKEYYENNLQINEHYRLNLTSSTDRSILQKMQN